MNDTDENRDESTCRCCSGIKEDAGHENRPCLPALRYRIGTHPTFLKRMIRQLPFENVKDENGNEQRPLARLKTRETSDPSVALLDAFAGAADVITFYQERIANECYLRTATERRSVLELARGISYELSPGVAAGTSVAFTVETATGGPEFVTLPGGTKVQSLPAPGKLPQTFETSEELVAKPQWNVFRPKITKTQEITGDIKKVILTDPTGSLKAGDGILFYSPSNNKLSLRRITAVKPDTATGTTTADIEYAGGLSTIPDNPQVTLFHNRANLFGYNAPDWKSMGSPARKNITFQGLLGQYYQGKNFETLKQCQLDDQVNFNWGTGSPVPGLGASQNSTDLFSILWTGFIRPDVEGNYTFSTLSDDGARLWVNGNLIINDWQDHDLTHPAFSNQVYLKKGVFYDVRLEYYENLGSAAVYLQWIVPGSIYPTTIPNEVLFSDRSELLPDWPDLKLTSDEVNNTAIHLDTGYPKIQSSSVVVLSCDGKVLPFFIRSVTDEARADFTLTAKTTCLHLEPFLTDPHVNLSEFAHKIRETVVYCQSEPAPLADVNNPDPIRNGETSVDINDIVTDLLQGKRLIIAGLSHPDGIPVSEELILKKIEPHESTTTLTFTQPLVHSYERNTDQKDPHSLRIYANVVPVTHGETVQEVLGSGSASLQNQQFTLKKPPLTYVADTMPGGRKSSLSVRVNRLLWNESPSLYGHAPGDETYEVRLDDNGTATVMFGDGKRGARLPTGTENVSAVYRSGTGPDGEVGAETLTLLPVRPPGIRGVTNPTGATGSAPPEEREQARRNAPMKVSTFNRVVSLQDYEDYARTYAGIAKAQATGVWAGENHGVCITIAGPDGCKIDDKTRDNLLSSIGECADPGHPVLAVSNEPVFFAVAATVTYDAPRYQKDDVDAAIKVALVRAFSFEQRSFGQSVTASEVIAAIQGVAGVVSVTSVYLWLPYGDGAGNTMIYSGYGSEDTADGADTAGIYLFAAQACFEDDTVRSSRLLLLNPDWIRVNGVML